MRKDGSLPGVLVLGFGNPLAGDDGAGPAVVAELARKGMPPGARAEDGASDSLRIPSMWRGEGRIWLVDALARGAPAGTITRLDHDEVLGIPQPHAAAHHLSLPESLRLIRLAHPEMGAVRYRLWGIEPASIGLLDPMCEAVRRAVALVAEEIRGQLCGPAGS